MTELEIADVQSLLDRWVHTHPAPEVLEAGCGSATQLRLPPASHLTGIDISQSQLDRNASVSVKILGDIEAYPLPAGAFDAIVCWDVLEHLPHPERALANFDRALRPGGLILLAFPNPHSLKGWITVATPHAFHVWVYRHVFGLAWAGQPGHGPFRTLFRPGMWPERIRAFAEARGLRVAYERRFEGPGVELFVRRHPIPGAVYRAGMTLLRVLTLGAVRAEQSDALVVLERPATS